MLSGCGGSDGDNSLETNIDTSVWKSYSNDHFSFKYPTEWYEHQNEKIDNNNDYINDEILLTFTSDDLDENDFNYTSSFWVEYILNDYGLDDHPKIDSETEFDEYTTETLKNVSSRYSILVNKKIKYKGYPAYKTIYTAEPNEYNKYKTKEYWVLVYKDNYIQSICYEARIDNYNQELADEIINSFQFND